MSPATACRVAALLLAALTPGAGAADESRVQLEQRIRLAARVMGDAPTALRIANSGNAQARSHFDEGRLHHAMAEDALRRDDLATARREVDEALRHMSTARRMVPDAPARQAATRQRQEQMLATLERLIEAWRAQTGPTDVLDGDLYAALGLIDTARHMADAGRHEEAVHILASAEKHVLTGMRHTLRGVEVDYTQRAHTPQQEYALELQRHQALVDLVPLALKELRPGAEAVSLIERYGETSRALRLQAQQQFGAGEVQQALAQIRSALIYVQRALQAAGVSTPAVSGSTP